LKFLPSFSNKLRAEKERIPIEEARCWVIFALSKREKEKGEGENKGKNLNKINSKRKLARN